MKQIELNEIQTEFETINEKIEISVSETESHKIAFIIKKSGIVQNRANNRTFVNLEECLKYVIDSNGFMNYIGKAKSTERYTLTNHIKLTIIKAYEENREKEVFVIRDCNKEIFRKSYPFNADIDMIMNEITETLHIQKEVEEYRMRQYNH